MAKERTPTHVLISHDEWTLETLRIYLEEMITNLHLLLDERGNEQRRAMEAALIAAVKAVDKAEIATDKRFEAVMTGQTMLNEVAMTHMTRDEYLTGHSRLQEQVNKNADDITKYVTRSENDAMHARIDDAMAELKERQNRQEGRGQAYMSSWLIVVAAISTVGVVVGIFVYIAEHH